MAGTVVISRGTTNPNDRSPKRSMLFAWTCDASGVVSGTSSPAINGVITHAVTKPGAGGAAPTDNYDVTLLDADGRDVLGGLCADRDTANTETVTPNQPVDGSTLELRVANAGNAKTGQLRIYFSIAWLLLCSALSAADISLEPKPDAKGVVPAEELIVLSTEAKGVGFVWNVIGPRGFVRLKVDTGDQSQAYLAVPKGGPYSVMLTVITQSADGKVGVDQGQSQFFVGAATPTPTPIPDVPPGPGPIPDTDEAVVPADGFRVLIVEEASDRPRLPFSQMVAYTGAKLKLVLDETCVKDSKGKPDWLIVDDDFEGISKIDVLPPHWHEAYKDAVAYAHAQPKLPSGAQQPVIIVSNRGVTSIVPPGELTLLPKNIAGIETLLKKYKK